MDLRLLTLPILAMALSACSMKISMPDHMVSDTVNAGVDLYKGLTKSNEMPVQQAPVKTERNAVLFSNTAVGDETLSIAVLKSSCVNEAASKARQALSNQDIKFKILSQNVSNADDKVVVNCSIEITS